jgi:Flp pilus assembly protein TadD
MSRRSALGLGLVGLALLVQYRWVAGISFINDDFLLLDHARHLDFLRVWSFDDAIGNAYRPLTRNLYFWAGRHVFGTNPAPYHLTNLALALVSLVLLFFTARELLARAQDSVPIHTVATRTRKAAKRSKTSRRSQASASSAAGAEPVPATLHACDGPALLAVLLFAVHPTAATPLSWVCGVQDGLAIVLAFGAALAHLRDARILYTLLFVGALLSKETTVLLPAVLWLSDVLLERRSILQATRRQLGPAVVLVAWALGDRWLPWHTLGSTAHATRPGERTVLGRADFTTLAIALRSIVLAEPFVSFDWPYGWIDTLAIAALYAGAFAVAITLPWPRRARAAIFAVAVAWALSGMLPLVAVTSHFTYYAYYPAAAATVAAAAGLTRLGARERTPLLRTGVAACLALVVFLGNGLKHATQLLDARAIQRSSNFLWNFKGDLLRFHPTLPDSARCYFKNLPHYVGFQVADGPAVRVWYNNPTLRSYYLTKYVPEHHPEYFFVCDSTGHMLEITRGLPDPHLRHAPAIYADGLNDLGAQLNDAGQTDAAMVEWRKALAVQPENEAALANMGLALVRAGRYAEGEPFLAHAVTLSAEDWDAQLALAIAEGGLGRYADAERRLIQIVSTVPATDDGQRAAAVLEIVRKRHQAAGAP